MRAGACLIYCLAFCLMGCNSNEKEWSPAEKQLRDSLSKVAYKLKADSMKRKNPLLFMPPDSLYSGDYTDKYSSGIIKFRGYYRLGQPHGQWMSFYPTGLLWSEMHFDKGLRHGPNVTYHENGKIRYSGFYKNDQQDSIWSYYDSTGKLAQKVLFQKDKIVRKLPLPTPK